MPNTLTATANEIDFGIAPPAGEMVVTQPQPAQEVATVPDGAMSSLIERMARDPAVNIDKLERLIAMQERMEAKRHQVEFDNAMADAQEEMKAIRADLFNKQTQSNYASYAALDKATRPIYAKHGFSLSFDTESAPDSCVRIICTVAHRSGHRERRQIDMPADGKGAKGGDVMTRTHATGAAASYGQRYLLKLIFNLAVGDADDDGNGAGGFGDDSDIERMAPANAARGADGKLLSNYNATKAQKAKDFADRIVTELNTSPNVEGAKEIRRFYSTVHPGKRKSDLDRLGDDSPGQYMRVKTTYENVTGEEF